MTAALLSFSTALLLDHTYHLTASSVVLSVVLALTVGAADRHGGEFRGAWLLAPVMLPLLAVASTEVGQRLFTNPNLGDTLFVVGMAGAIWLRRLGPQVRRAGALLSSALIAVLITPGPAVPLGSHPPSRWWAAVIALVALGWVRVARAVAQRLGIISATEPESAAPPLPRPSPASAEVPWHRRLPASTRMALQMAVALGAAFACGRAAFGDHWTWVVLSAYIVGSGNRGRGDVTYKAVLRIAGAAGGTLIATALSGAFARGDDGSIVALFAVIAVALWLRPLSYAFWALGMTAALALLYDYYGEVGDHLLATRLEGILLGAGIAVLTAWTVSPIRNVDAARRQLAVALATVADVLTSDDEAPVFGAEHVARFRAAAKAADLAAASLRWTGHLPPRLRGPHSYAVASRAVAVFASQVEAGRQLALPPDTRRALSSDVAAARRALAATATECQRASLGATTQRIAGVLAAGYE